MCKVNFLTIKIGVEITIYPTLASSKCLFSFKETPQYKMFYRRKSTFYNKTDEISNQN